MSERITEAQLQQAEADLAGVPDGIKTLNHYLVAEVRRLRELILAHQDTGWRDDLPAAQAFFAEAEAIRAEKG